MSREISPKQLRVLQALAFGAMRLSREEKDEAVAAVVPGKEHFHALTTREADRVINEWKRRLNQPIARRYLPRRQREATTALVSEYQREEIEALRKDCRELDATPEFLDGVVERACGRPSPRTSAEAGTVIEALKAVLKRLFQRPEVPA